MSEKYPLGKCPVCGFNIRLRKSGTVGAHQIYVGQKSLGYCKGAGHKPGSVVPIESLLTDEDYAVMAMDDD